MSKEDKYSNFKELAKARPKSFKVEYHDSKDGAFLMFTPHGGGIEPGTTEICEWYRDRAFSYYSFTGEGKNCGDLHITSTKYNEPILLKLLAEHQYAVSFHGMADKNGDKHPVDIFLGGLNRGLVALLEKKLHDIGYSVATSIEHPKSPFAALRKGNVTNKCKSGFGVQIELSESLRASFFKKDFKLKKGRMVKTENFDQFCLAIYEVIVAEKKKPN